MNDLKTRYANAENKVSEYRSIEGKVKDYENKIALLTQEIERLNTLNRSKSEDIEVLEREKVELHTKMTFYKNYELKISESEQAAAQLTNQIRNLTKDV